MNQVQYCVDEAGTKFKPGRLSELYLKKELENILQSFILRFTYTLYLAMFFSIGIKYTIIIVSLVVLVG